MIDYIPEKYRSRLLYLGKGGSVAYGTNTPHSDIDLRGVYMPTRLELLTTNGEKAFSSVANGIDVVLWELRHFIALAVKGCPSALELLFYPPDVEIYTSSEWEKLQDIRQYFLGKHLQKTLGGFANSDIRAIKEGKSSRAGTKGAELIKKFGYNTKHAANAMRLLFMSHDVAFSKHLPVRLPKHVASLIKSIKNGLYSKDSLLLETKLISSIVDALYVRSDLDKNADASYIYETIEDIVFMNGLRNNLSINGSG